VNRNQRPDADDGTDCEYCGKRLAAGPCACQREHEARDGGLTEEQEPPERLTDCIYDDRPYHCLNCMQRVGVHPSEQADDEMDPEAARAESEEQERTEETEPPERLTDCINCLTCRRECDLHPEDLPVGGCCCWEPYHCDMSGADEAAVADGSAEMGTNEAAEEAKDAEDWAAWNEYLWRVGDLHDGHDCVDAESGQAEDEMRRQAEVDALGGNVPPYDETDDSEGQEVVRAAYMQWTADRYATGLADCDGPPECWLCANYPCETHATDLPCLGGYVPVSSQAMESDPILTALARQRLAQILAEVGESAETSVMTPINQRWDSFACELDAAIRAEDCDAETLRLSERLLRGIDGIDVAKSLAYFKANGGFCDCEVLRNVAC
jgi:hypothetical protein